MELEEGISQKDIKNLSRKQRHDFMNVLQVVYGYLQLDRKEDAIEEIKNSTIISSSISQLSKISILEIYLMFEKKLVEMINLGIYLNVEVETDYDGVHRKIKNDLQTIENIEKDINFLLKPWIDEVKYGKFYYDVKVIEKLESLKIIYMSKNYNFKEKEIKKYKKIYKNIDIVESEVTITFDFEEVKNIQIKDSIYSKIYSNNI